MNSTSAPTRPVIGHVLHRLHYAGAEVLAADLARRLRDRYEFVFLCLDGVGPLGEQLATEGYTVVDFGRRPGLDLRVSRRMAAAVRQHQVALVHAHQYTPFFYAAAARLPAASWLFKGPRILFTEHGRHYPDQRRPKRVLANRFLLRRRDRVTAVGQFVRQALIDNEGLPPPRIEVIHNGIDPAHFAAGDGALRARTRAELRLADGQAALLQVARFHSVKDHPTAVRALAQMVVALKKGSDPILPVLLLAGDGDERAAIEKLAGELGVAPHVRFLGVRIDVPALMAAADVFLLSSLSEGISVTLLEAMASGLPIAATDVGGNSEVVAHGETGLLSPRRDPAALAHNLLALLGDAALRQKMGQAGRKRLLAHFTQEQMHQGYIKVYEQMLARTSPRIPRT